MIFVTVSIFLWVFFFSVEKKVDLVISVNGVFFFPVAIVQGIDDAGREGGGTFIFFEMEIKRGEDTSGGL